jgi:hypothetical protein
VQFPIWLPIFVGIWNLIVFPTVIWYFCCYKKRPAWARRTVECFFCCGLLHKYLYGLPTATATATATATTRPVAVAMAVPTAV